MQKFSREIVAEVLAATDIVDVIGGCIELKPAGSGRLKAPCPFHIEKDPSFYVNRDRQQYYCFGCQKHGDAISFICDYEGLPFMDALRKLADKAGIRLPAASKFDDKEDQLRIELIEFGKFAARFFIEKLNDPLKGSLGRQYLKTRGLKPETVKRFGLGYAPDGWTNLADEAHGKGFHDPVLEASGLARRGDRGSVYDFFRNRLMIPIRDVSGKVVAFGGRALGDETPKYINSPENLLYKKSRILYGLYEARDALRREKRAILVEGYFDLMRCFDDGIENIVATCGTALTPEQAALLHRYVPEVVLVYDADAAGITAALRGVGILTNAGLTVRAMALPDGKDPDDYVKAHGADAFRDLVDNALDFVSFYARMSGKRIATIEGKTTVAHEIFTILSGMNDELRRDEYLKRTAHELQLNEWACRNEFAKHLHEQTERTTHPAAAPAAKKPVSRDECDFVAVLLGNEPLLREVKKTLAPLKLQPSALTEVLRVLFEDADVGAARRLETEEAQNLYAAAANSPGLPPDKMAEIVEKMVASLQGKALLVENTQIAREISEAERTHDDERVTELQKRKVGLKEQMRKVGAT